MERIVPEFPKSIDSTILSTYTDCPQKFFIEYCLRLAPQGVSPDLHAGGALAAGFEAARHAFYYDGLSSMQAVARGLEALTQYWGDYEPPENHAKTWETTAFALSEYFAYWDPELDPIQPVRLPDGRPSIEFTFAIPTEVKHPITGDPILYSGRCDMVAFFDDRVCVVDEKTTKGIGPKWQFKWNMRGQFHGYAFAWNYIGGAECEYALVRGISLQKTESKFEQAMVPIPLWKQQRWWLHTNQKIRELVEKWHRMKEMEERITQQLGADHNLEDHIARANHMPWTYAFGEACENFGGCAFKGMCTRQYPENWYEDYDRRVWDPLAKNPTEGSETRLSKMDSIDLPPEAQALYGVS